MLKVEALKPNICLVIFFAESVPLNCDFVGHIFNEALKVEGLENAVINCVCLNHVPCNLGA